MQTEQLSPGTWPHWLPGCQEGRARLFPSTREDFCTSEGYQHPVEHCCCQTPSSCTPTFSPESHQVGHSPQMSGERGGSCPGDEGQRAGLISPSCDGSHEWRGRREQIPHLCQTILQESSHYHFLHLEQLQAFHFPKVCGICDLLQQERDFWLAQRSTPHPPRCQLNTPG